MTSESIPQVRVLLVDDHPVVRSGVKALLESSGKLRLTAEAGTGEAALEILSTSAQDVDVVVMDLQMGAGMNGVEATRRITVEYDLPVLILTTFDTQADIVAAMGAGATGYLLKDAPSETVQHAVLDAAARKPVLSPSVTAQMMKRLASPATTLTAREIEILQELASGATNRDLARVLFISEATVKTHLVHIYDKLGVENRTQAVDQARAQRII
ncbi:response regulator transcription factor [Nesterenkonia sp. E16_7]|uniref:response regulator n=1 Tax=unclassified Nesterenkonia TaxID=2629769 RepID=UPI001A90EEB5|nr:MULTISPECIES: response regulator transcription factor [unclassified Nesterenkonia]MBO0594721.1 response regulator transcription factor [Nesterenkonia sp. E16_10]MBO0597470.1 response regulator transcription factor [Nesterenkonia sp. E16_7]